MYQLTQDIRVPAGSALKNIKIGDITIGNGGGWQFYLDAPNAASVLEQVGNIPLH